MEEGAPEPSPPGLAPARGPSEPVPALPPSEVAAAGTAARRDRLGLLIPILLAAIGLAAALIAWRTSMAAGVADAATQAGLDAARGRATSVIVGEGLTTRSVEAYLDYERSRRRAELLADAGEGVEAQRARMEAVSHWFLVRPEYLDADGAYLPDRQRAAILAADETRLDLQPDPHFAVADREQQRIRLLLVAGVLIALGLPFLTLAEMTRRRLRTTALVLGSTVFALGLGVAGFAWL